ncbi:MAG: hypothetical protein M1828_003965 [Chrysothrix sp. TS-e1954]|nr:MAG: hypothetical protein M1828_003965 [Chrysothrix sp. TS-e1954]
MFSKAPWSSHKQDQQQRPSEEEDQSLTTILNTHEDRTNLLLLVADCTDRMRKSIADVFNADVDSRPTERPDLPAPEETPREDRNLKVDELELSNPGMGDPASDQAKDEAEAAKAEAAAQQNAEDKAKKEHERRLKEVATPKMLELKDAALSHFDEWRDRVLERIGEAVNKHADPKEEQKTTQHAAKATSARGPSQQPQKLEEADEDEEVNNALHAHFPPVDTSLLKLDKAKRLLILHAMLLLNLSLEYYSSESRALLLYISSSLHLPIEFLAEDETKVARGLLEAAQQSMNADATTKKKAEENAFSKKWKVGLGAVGGAVLIGVTGGLAAPLLAAGIGSVMGGLGLGATATATYLGAMAGSAPLVGALFGTYGGLKSAEIMNAYAREVADFAFIPTRKSSVLSFSSPSSSSQPDHSTSKETQRLRVAMGVSGWLNTDQDVVKPWHIVSPSHAEPFALRWELKALIELGNSFTTYVKSAAWSLAKTEIIRHTVFAAVTAGLWPLGIVKVARVIDNPFSVARSRSEKAGRVLADALINKVQGQRPVTLVGYSLGARLIFSCLEELANRKAFGLVESVVLAGAAVPSDSLAWRKVRTVVSGRVVNVFSTTDYLLGFLYRTSSFQFGIAGLQPIAGVGGVENVDVSDLIDGHLKYRFLMGRVLKRIGFSDIDLAAVEKQEKELEAEERKDREEQERKKKEASEKGDQEKDAEGEIADMEQEVERKNKKAGAMEWVSDKMSSMKIGRSKSPQTQQKDGADDGNKTEEKAPPLPDRRKPTTEDEGRERRGSRPLKTQFESDGHRGSVASPAGTEAADYGPVEVSHGPIKMDENE